MTTTARKKCEKCGGTGLLKHEPRQMTAPDGTKTADPLDRQQYDLCPPCGGSGSVPDLHTKPAVKGSGSIVDTFNSKTAFVPYEIDYTRAIDSLTLEDIEHAIGLIERNPGISPDYKQKAVEDLETVWVRMIEDWARRVMEKAKRACIEYSTTARVGRPGRRADDETAWQFGTACAGAQPDGEA